MFEIDDAAEAALAFVALKRDSIPCEIEDGFTVRALLDLREAGMVKGETDWNQQIFMLAGVLPAGIEHYQRVQRLRRRFVSLTETADELVGWTYARVACQKRAGRVANPEILDGRLADYQELSKAGLLKIQWADDSPWLVQTTQKGLSYVRGDFVDEGDSMNINISPVFNNSNIGSTASASVDVDVNIIESAVDAIRKTNVDEDVKQDAETAVRDMGDAARGGDIEKFASALENTASIVKSSTALGACLFPVIGELISKFFS